jgi:hypothetical protein
VDEEKRRKRERVGRDQRIACGGYVVVRRFQTVD